MRETNCRTAHVSYSLRSVMPAIWNVYQFYHNINIEREQVHFREQSMCCGDLRASLLGVNSFHFTSSCKLHALRMLLMCVYRSHVNKQ